jgi:hypothetical protein
METTAADFAKIQAGAAMYQEVFRDRPDKAGEFLVCLQGKPGWAVSEIMALQMRVADVLMDYGMTGPIIQDARVS